MMADTLAKEGAPVRQTQQGGELPAEAGLQVVIIGCEGIDGLAARLTGAGYRVRPFILPSNIPAMPAGFAEACSTADVLVSILPSDALVEAVILGSGGAVANLRRGALHIGVGAVSVACSDRLVEAHWEASSRYVSAPIFRPGGSAGQGGALLAAGGAQALEGAAPVLAHLGCAVATIEGWPTKANRRRRNPPSSQSVHV